MSSNNAIVVHGLVVDHITASGVVRALEIESASFAPGASAAVMGPSGCGKSTLLGVMAGLSTPTGGTVTIGDVVVSALPERQRVRFRRQTVGMVYQADNLLPHLTVEENVGLQLAICRRHEQSDAAFDPLQLLQHLGLAALTKRFPDQLSGGQRQRVAVARAIVHRPAVILADEPTGSLDVENARAVIELLADVHRRLDATLVVVTHDPGVARYMDKTMLLSGPVQAGGQARAG